MILVFGKKGQVATHLEKVLPQDTLFVGSDDFNLAEVPKISGLLSQQKPHMVINAAAYTAVDKAENDKELAFLLNASAPEKMAEWCAQNGIPLIHYSTDYVYPGTGQAPWKETDATQPVNYYGKTKLMGEEGIRKRGGPHLIFRTSWVYAENGTNFVNTMLRLGAERETLKVVGDQWGSPTYARDIAESTAAIIPKISQPQFNDWGVYHLAGNGFTCWHDFAEEIFQQARAFSAPMKVSKVENIKTSEYPTPAQRPLNSRLNQDKLKMIFGLALPQWQESLHRCLTFKFSQKSLR